MEIQINFLAVLAALAANFILGFLWYGPIFGKIWAREMGMPADMKPEKGVMIRGLVLTLIGAFLLAYVLAHNSWAWYFVFDKTMTVPANPAIMGFFSGLWTWLGFFVPGLFSSVAWEGKSWKLFGINAAYHFVNLQIVAMIISFWR